MIKPLRNYVLLKKEEVQEKKFGDIILSSKKDSGNIAVIMEKGEDIKNKELNIGKKVIYKEYSTTSFKDENDNEYLLIKEEDILAIVE